MYKHYSFDLWSTLIKSNPNFKTARAEYFWKHFNRNNKSKTEVEEIIRDIDKMCDYSNQMVGSQIDGIEMYAMVLFKLGYPIDNLSARDIVSIYLNVENIFTANPPIPYDADTIPVLRKIKASGATLSILSNTSFVKGISMQKYIANSDFAELFIFQIYSDQVGSSKPDEGIFSAMTQHLHRHRMLNPVKHNEIIHIGDNEYADIAGAKKAGLASMRINHNGKTIKDVI